jgi:hypothetical protein
MAPVSPPPPAPPSNKYQDLLYNIVFFFATSLVAKNILALTQNNAFINRDHSEDEFDSFAKQINSNIQNYVILQDIGAPVLIGTSIVMAIYEFFNIKKENESFLSVSIARFLLLTLSFYIKWALFSHNKYLSLRLSEHNEEAAESAINDIYVITQYLIACHLLIIGSIFFIPVVSFIKERMPRFLDNHERFMRNLYLSIMEDLKDNQFFKDKSIGLTLECYFEKLHEEERVPTKEDLHEWIHKAGLSNFLHYLITREWDTTEWKHCLTSVLEETNTLSLSDLDILESAKRIRFNYYLFSAEDMGVRWVQYLLTSLTQAEPHNSHANNEKKSFLKRIITAVQTGKISMLNDYFNPGENSRRATGIEQNVIEIVYSFLFANKQSKNMVKILNHFPIGFTITDIDTFRKLGLSLVILMENAKNTKIILFFLKGLPHFDPNSSLNDSDDNTYQKWLLRILKAATLEKLLKHEKDTITRELIRIFGEENVAIQLALYAGDPEKDRSWLFYVKKIFRAEFIAAHNELFQKILTNKERQNKKKDIYNSSDLEQIPASIIPPEIEPGESSSSLSSSSLESKIASQSFFPSVESVSEVEIELNNAPTQSPSLQSMIASQSTHLSTESSIKDEIVFNNTPTPVPSLANGNNTPLIDKDYDAMSDYINTHSILEVQGEIALCLERFHSDVSKKNSNKTALIRKAKTLFSLLLDLKYDLSFIETSKYHFAFQSILDFNQKWQWIANNPYSESSHFLIEEWFNNPQSIFGQAIFLTETLSETENILLTHWATPEKFIACVKIFLEHRSTQIDKLDIFFKDDKNQIDNDDILTALSILSQYLEKTKQANLRSVRLFKRKLFLQLQSQSNAIDFALLLKKEKLTFDFFNALTPEEIPHLSAETINTLFNKEIEIGPFFESIEKRKAANVYQRPADIAFSLLSQQNSVLTDEVIINLSKLLTNSQRNDFPKKIAFDTDFLLRMLIRFSHCFPVEKFFNKIIAEKNELIEAIWIKITDPANKNYYQTALPIHIFDGISLLIQQQAYNEGKTDRLVQYFNNAIDSNYLKIHQLDYVHLAQIIDELYQARAISSIPLLSDFTPHFLLAVITSKEKFSWSFCQFIARQYIPLFQGLLASLAESYKIAGNINALSERFLAHCQTNINKLVQKMQLTQNTENSPRFYGNYLDLLCLYISSWNHLMYFLGSNDPSDDFHFFPQNRVMSFELHYLLQQKNTKFIKDNFTLLKTLYERLKGAVTYYYGSSLEELFDFANSVSLPLIPYKNLNQFAPIDNDYLEISDFDFGVEIDHITHYQGLLNFSYQAINLLTKYTGFAVKEIVHSFPYQGDFYCTVTFLNNNSEVTFKKKFGPPVFSSAGKLIYSDSELFGHLIYTPCTEKRLHPFYLWKNRQFSINQKDYDFVSPINNDKIEYKQKSLFHHVVKKLVYYLYKNMSLIDEDLPILENALLNKNTVFFMEVMGIYQTKVLSKINDQGLRLQFIKMFEQLCHSYELKLNVILANAPVVTNVPAWKAQQVPPSISQQSNVDVPSPDMEQIGERRFSQLE